MRRPELCRLLAVFAANWLLVATAQAQATRTWVSGVGDDANPCSRTAPCKTFAGAISKTAAGGEIDALDSGGFGAVTITKAITIDGSGALTSVLGSGGTNGIVVAAGASDVVVLRGLSLNGAGTGLSGVRFNAGKALHVEDCAISGFGGTGEAAIRFTPTSGGGHLVVRGTSVRNGSAAGVRVSAAAGAANAISVTIEKSLLSTADVGLDVDGASTISVTVHDTVVSGNATAGIRATGTAPVQVNVDHGLVANNGVGVQASGSAVVRLSEVMVSDNGTGISGNVASFGNNRISAGNGTDGAPAATLPQQ